MWSPLPDGQSIEFAPGAFYAVVASVKATHSKADILSLASDRGLSVFDIAEEGERAGLGPDPHSPDYRFVALQAQAQHTGSVPWSVPFPASMWDSSRIVEAWVSPSSSLPPSPPSPSPPAPSSRPTAAVALTVAIGSALSWLAWRALRKRRRT